MPGRLFYVIVNFYMLISHALVKGRYQTCSEFPAVEGRSSEIRCYFHENLARTQTNFTVFRYENNPGLEVGGACGTDSTVCPAGTRCVATTCQCQLPISHQTDNLCELVLTCRWTRTGEVPDCVARSGYIFDPFDLITTDSQTIATIVIPYVSRGHAGVYSCQSSRGGVSTSSYTCNYGVIGTNIGCTAGRVTEGERSTIVCHFNQDLNVTKGSFALRHISESGVHETVIACNWGKHSGKFVCAHSPGYTLISDIKQTVAISIPKTTPQNGGQYQCVTVPEYKWVTSECCILQVTTVTTTPGQDVAQNTKKIDTINVEAPLSGLNGLPFLIITILLVIVLAIVLVIFKQRGVLSRQSRLVTCFLRRRLSTEGASIRYVPGHGIAPV